MMQYGENTNTETNTKNHKKRESYTLPAMLLVTFSIHGLLEGIVFGIQTAKSTTLSLLIAILVHKPVEALVLGVLMLRSKVSRWIYILFSTILALVTPIGVTLGILISGLNIPDLVIGSLTSLTIGSFLFISTTEIIAEEFQKKPNVGYFISYLVGVTLVLLLELI